MKSARPASTFHSSSRGATLGCFLLLCSAPIASLAQNQAQPIDPSQQVIEHVHGVVLNSVDKKPIARALVASSDQRMATMTDSDGRFSFDVRRPVANPASTTGLSPLMNARRVSQIMINLTVRRPGYLNMNQLLRISADPQSSIDEVQLKLVPESMIRGHLSTSNGTKPSGITIQLLRKQVQDGAATWIQNGGTQANSHDDYTFGDLPAGDYKLMSLAHTERGFGGTSGSDESSGYAPTYFGDSADLASSPVIHLDPGQTAEANLNPRAATFYHVAVPVANVPKDGGLNIVVGSQQSQTGLFMSLNPQTQMAEGFLPNGAYDIHAFTFGQSPGSGIGRVEVAGKPVKASPITLSPAGQIAVIVHQEYTASNSNQPSGPTDMQLAQRRPVNITLRPVNLDGQWASLKNPTSKDDQDLVLENVQPGAYYVTASQARGYVAAMSANNVDLLRQPLVVGPGGGGGPIDITLRDDSATLTGTISSPGTTATQPDPMAIFAVLCIPVDTSSAAQMPGIVANQGKFTVPNLPPGDYLVFAMSLTPNNSIPQIEYRNPDVLREYQTKGTTVTLSPGQKAEIQVPLLPNPGEDN
jgi:hypothetical protein